MAIGSDDVRHVAELARLALDERAARAFTDDLQSILGYVDSVLAADVDEDVSFPAPMTLRPDRVIDVDPAELIRAAPALADGLFAVSRVVDKG